MSQGSNTSKPLRSVQLTSPRPVARSVRRAVGTSTTTRELMAPALPAIPRGVWLGALVLVATMLGGGVIIGAPYKDAERLGRALERGDEKRIAALVDFPAVREDLKVQMAKLAGQQGDDHPGMAMLGSAMASAMIDASVRPEMVAKLKELPIDEDTAARVRLALKHAKVGYDSPLSFSIRIPLTELSDEPLRIVMTRSGPMSWQVRRVMIPQDLSKLEALAAKHQQQEQPESNAARVSVTVNGVQIESR